MNTSDNPIPHPLPPSPWSRAQTRIHMSRHEFLDRLGLPTTFPEFFPPRLEQYRRSISEATDTPAVLFVPGGTDGTLAVMQDPEVLDFLVSRSTAARYVTSVCTGSLVLAAAGLLRGRRATTHWLALESLRAFGVESVAERVVVDGNRITGAGVTAGIDFALTLAAALTDETYAKGVQLMMEYDPHPPFQSGRPDAADPDTVAMLEAMVVGFNRDVEAVAGRPTEGRGAGAPTGGR